MVAQVSPVLPSRPRARAAHATPKLELVSDPIQSAKAAGLRYATDDKPGIGRKGSLKAFRYVDAHGKAVRDPETLARIRHLAIPPAWTKVWISPIANGHLQATGRDVKGRKQYRYHARWRETRDETKYERMLAFADALPKIRAKVSSDLAMPALPREKVLATVVRLLETTLIRVGNEEYARTNHSFGLTTMLDKHVDVTGGTIRFRFRGKSGVDHDVDVHDRRLARIVKKSQELPGHELFHYVDDAGNVHPIESGDVNAYLHAVAGEEFTAKDFRTWAGTVLAAMALRELEKFDSQAQAKRNVVEAIKSVAQRLGNTPSVCRKCYVHPAVLNGYMDGVLVDTIKQRAEHILKDALHALTPEEAAVMAFLQQQLGREKEPLESKLQRAVAHAKTEKKKQQKSGRREAKRT